MEVLSEGSDNGVDCGADALDFETIGEAKYFTSASGLEHHWMAADIVCVVKFLCLQLL